MSFSMSEPVAAWAEPSSSPLIRLAHLIKTHFSWKSESTRAAAGRYIRTPVIERVFDEKENKPYIALFLENRYLKIMVLPELGGRLPNGTRQDQQPPFRLL